MGCVGQSDREHLEYRKKTDDMGNKYAQYVHKLFAVEWGIPEYMVKPFETKDEQCDIGENRFGLEIKYDEKSIKSKNIYIEIAEKSVPSRETYTRSGIYRVDNSWLFLIGNYDIYYVFYIDYIRKMNTERNWARVETSTSQGFLMPHKQARDLSLYFTLLKEEEEKNEFEQLDFSFLKPIPDHI